MQKFLIQETSFFNEISLNEMILKSLGLHEDKEKSNLGNRKGGGDLTIRSKILNYPWSIINEFMYEDEVD